MTYRAILTPVADDDVVAPHLGAAVEVARAFDAVLIGSAAGYCPPRAVDLVPASSGELLMVECSLIDDELRAARRRFETACGDVRQRWIGKVEPPLAALTRRAAMGDLIVMGAMPQDQGGMIRNVSIGDAVMKAGRPVLAVGQRGMPRLPHTVAIAWKNCREARRAVTEAMPFLKHAEAVLAFAVAEPGAGGEERDALSALVTHLQDHGVCCTASVLPKVTTTGQDIVAAAARAGAGLLVAGAYGRPRVEEWAFGGVTRTLLTRCDIPVLFSH